jgi:hypothetical protein
MPRISPVMAIVLLVAFPLFARFHPMAPNTIASTPTGQTNKLTPGTNASAVAMIPQIMAAVPRPLRACCM